MSLSLSLFLPLFETVTDYGSLNVIITLCVSTGANLARPLSLTGQMMALSDKYKHIVTA